MSWFDGARARLRLLSGRWADSRMQREFGFHLEMEAERLMRDGGLSPAEARRRAAVAFGGVEKYQEELRSERGTAWLKGLALDLKLGLRLLFKHPGFTLISGFGIMVAIAFMSGIFTFLYTSIYAKLPLPEGDRIVALENRDTKVNNEEQRSLHDLVLWRSQMKSVVEISAFHEYETALFVDNTPWLVSIASMTASAFRLARVAPMMGRYLTEEDELEGAADVLVIGHDAWRDRFQLDPKVVRRTVRLGRRVYSIVGVMPEGYGFPRNHQYWVPFRLDPLKIPRGEGPELFIFGRLRDDASIANAQAELSVIGQRSAAQFPLTNKNLEPAVMPYAHALLDIQGINGMAIVYAQLMTSMVLFVVAMNVAILVYARTAMRRGEIAIRTALGASRMRIVVQLFLEAFVLALFPALLGLPIAQYGLRIGDGILIQNQDLGGPTPFWTDLSLQPVTVFYTLFLVVIAAAVIGVLPALRATGRHVQSDIRQLGGGGGLKLGRMWTVMIATQVAVAVAALPQVVKLGLGQMYKSFEHANYDGVFLSFGTGLTEAYDSVGVAEANALFGDRMTRLLDQLASDRELEGVTISGGIPNFEIRKQIEVTGDNGRSVYAPSNVVASMGVDTARFHVFGLPILAGRGFNANDLAPNASSVIVNRSFVRKVLQDGRAVGHRLRYMGEDKDGKEAMPSRWYDIVGVVEDMRSNPLNPDAGRADIYFAVSPSQLRQAGVMARLKPSTVTPTLAQRLPAMINAELPELRVGPMRTVDGVDRENQLIVRLVAMITILVMVSVLLLCAAGIYALMSFTVTQRWREIGIRSALGATPRRVLAGVFSRVAMQIGLGIVVGIAAALALDPFTGKKVPGTGGFIPAVIVVMAVVAFVAAAGPARRGLRVQPIDALKSQ